MSSLHRVAGTSYVKVDAGQLALRGSHTIRPAAFTREGIAGLDGVHGYKETPRIPSIEVEVTLTRDLSVKKVAGLTNVTVTSELANGRVFVLSQAWQAGDLDLNAVEGSVTIRFEGMSCREIDPS